MAGPVDVGNVTCDGRGSDYGTHVRTVAAAPRLGPRRRPDVRYTRSFFDVARRARRSLAARVTLDILLLVPRAALLLGWLFSSKSQIS